MKQIVEETFDNGRKQWRVVTDRCFFGLFHCKWRTDKRVEHDYVGRHTVPAVFGTLREAEIFAYGTRKKKVVERRVLPAKNAVSEA